MKTLYININNEQIQSNEELEVLKYDLDSDFFFYLGEKIAKGCNVDNENAIITDFKTQDNEEEYKQIIAQWNEIKAILFSEEHEREFEFRLPKGYIHWLRYSEKYNHVYDKNFSHGESDVISIDLEDLYEDSIEELQRKILRKLQRDDLYLEIDEVVFNDDAVTRKSPIIRTIKEKYDGIRFKAYEKWQGLRQRRKEELQSKEEDTIPPIEKSMPIINSEKSKIESNSTKTFIIFLWQNKYLFVDENNELILRFPADTNFGGGTSYGKVDYFRLFLYLWKIFEYEYDIFWAQKQMPTSSVPPMIMELLEDEIIRVKDEKIVLALHLSSLENFKDDFESELTSYCINLSRYLRYNFRFNYLNNDITKTLVSWGIIREYFGYITKTKLLCDNIYKKISDISSNGDIIAISDGSKKYILNQSTGNVLPIEFENIPRFQEDLAKVLNNGKWGYIDSSGNIVISLQYEEASNFSNGTARVKLNGKYYLINKKGELFEGFVPLDKR